jgi:hypothetical protein
MDMSALGAELRPETLKAWNLYVSETEELHVKELGSANGYLLQNSISPEVSAEMQNVTRSGGVFIRKLETKRGGGGEIEVPGGIIHHWAGTVFVPGAKLEEVLRFTQNYYQHPQYYDEVVAASVLVHEGDFFRVRLKLKRKKVITVFYNTENEIRYQMHGPKRASCKSVATKIRELDNPGTPKEREIPVGEDRGFLWRLNAYWRYQEVEDGVIVECESLSLSRTIPTGLGWVVRPFMESIPKESLEAALLPIRSALSGGRTLGRLKPSPFLLVEPRRLRTQEPRFRRAQGTPRQSHRSPR